MLIQPAERHWDHGCSGPLASRNLQIGRFLLLLFGEDAKCVRLESS